MAPDIAISAANDYRLASTTGTAWLGYYRSFDGGRTWNNHLVPGYPTSANTTYPLYGFDSASDPSVAYDLQGNTYLAGIAFNGLSGTARDGTLFVARSSDGGITFPNATIISRGSGTTLFNDKPYMTVDAHATSPYKGRVYTSWTQFTSTRASILFSCSKDQGRTWSTSRNLSTFATNQGSIPYVGPAGEVYVVWLDLVHNELEITKSLDGGVSFSNVGAVQAITPIPSPLPNTFFRTNSFPTMAVDDKTGTCLSPGVTTGLDTPTSSLLDPSTVGLHGRLR